jgi:hypothetical protein
MADQRPLYAHVFHGVINGNTVSGFWTDVPGGQLRHSGSLTLVIEPGGRLSVTSQSGDRFTGSTLTFREAWGGQTTPPDNPPRGDAGGSSNNPVVGSWRWQNGAIIEVYGDGSLQVRDASGGLKPAGRWTLSNSTYTFRWLNNWTDTMTLNAAGNRLEGRNNTGSRVTADKIGGTTGTGVSDESDQAQGDPTSRAEGIERGDDPGIGESGGPGGGIVGSWRWQNGAIIEIYEDGSLLVRDPAAGLKPAGSWVFSNGRYSFRWLNNWTDTMTLNAAGNRMEGRNNTGGGVTAEKIGGTTGRGNLGGGQPCGKAVAGDWQWFNGARVKIFEDGRMTAGGLTGTCVLAGGGRYTLTWSNGYVDTMTLVRNGQRLEGKNRGGLTVWGDRIVAGDSGSPWTTSTGQSCFDQYILDVERRLNSFDGGPEHNGRKPWFINQWGILNSRSAFGPTSDRAPDDFGRFDNRYHYMWTYWHRTSYTWGDAVLDSAGVPEKNGRLTVWVR